MKTNSQTSPEHKKLGPIIVQQGKLLDFVDGVTQRNEPPEEYVRQEIAKSLVREYGYAKRDIAVEFTLRLGVKKPRLDLVLFFAGAEHAQEHAHIIVECKAQSVRPSDRREGVEQMLSYMSACPNATYGMWTNGLDCFSPSAGVTTTSQGTKAFRNRRHSGSY